MPSPAGQLGEEQHARHHRVVAQARRHGADLPAADVVGVDAALNDLAQGQRHEGELHERENERADSMECGEEKVEKRDIEKKDKVSMKSTTILKFDNLLLLSVFI